MNLPPLDHVGWGRLMAAVMESDHEPTRTPQETPESADIDLVRLRRRERAERTVVLEGSTDVYA